MVDFLGIVSDPNGSYLQISEDRKTQLNASFVGYQNLQTFLQEIFHVSQQCEQMTALDDTHTAQIEYVNFFVDFLATLRFDGMNGFVVPLLCKQFDARV